MAAPEPARPTIKVNVLATSLFNSTHFIFDTHAVPIRNKQLLFIHRLAIFIPSRSATERNLLPPFVTPLNLPKRYFPHHLIASSTKKKANTNIKDYYTHAKIKTNGEIVIGSFNRSDAV
jgi:hypothetical protein